MRKTYLKILLILVFALSFGQECVALNITIDPGHGGNSRGCFYEYDGTVIEEKDLNMKIAVYLKDELNKYQTKDGHNINVYFTRDEFENPSLKERIDFGKKKRSDVIISLHNNASSDDSGNYRGCMALVTSSHFNNKYEIEANLASNVLAELNKLGIGFSRDTLSGIANNDNGLLRRLADNGDTYPNGEVADWYGIIMHGIFENVPSIIIEHAYLDNEYDYRQFLCSDEKLNKLAVADANGIIKYYGLVPKGTTIPPEENKKAGSEINEPVETTPENSKNDAKSVNDRKIKKETPKNNVSTTSTATQKEPEPITAEAEDNSTSEEEAHTVECFSSNHMVAEPIIEENYSNVEEEFPEKSNDNVILFVLVLIGITVICYSIQKRRIKK